MPKAFLFLSNYKFTPNEEAHRASRTNGNFLVHINKPKWTQIYHQLNFDFKTFQWFRKKETLECDLDKPKLIVAKIDLFREFSHKKKKIRAKSSFYQIFFKIQIFSIIFNSIKVFSQMARFLAVFLNLVSLILKSLRE